MVKRHYHFSKFLGHAHLALKLAQNTKVIPAPSASIKKGGASPMVMRLSRRSLGSIPLFSKASTHNTTWPPRSSTSLNNWIGSGSPLGCPSFSSSPFSAHLEPSGVRKICVSWSRLRPEAAKIRVGIIFLLSSPLHTIINFSLTKLLFKVRSLRR